MVLTIILKKYLEILIRIFNFTKRMVVISLPDVDSW